METIDLVVLTRDNYSSLCIALGMGWGLFLATAIGAAIIDRIRWGHWLQGKRP